MGNLLEVQIADDIRGACDLPSSKKDPCYDLIYFYCGLYVLDAPIVDAQHIFVF